MNTFVIILIVLASVVAVLSLPVGLVVFKMMNEARHSKSIWHQIWNKCPSPVTSVSVQMRPPPVLISGYTQKMLDIAAGLSSDCGRSGRAFPLIIVVDCWAHFKNMKMVIDSCAYERYAQKKAGDKVLVQMGLSSLYGGISWEVRQTLHQIQVAGLVPDKPVHVIVCPSPRVALLRAVWDQTKGTPETWFYVVDGAPIRMWFAETVRLSLYYVATCFGKLRQLVVPIIDNQAV